MNKFSLLVIIVLSLLSSCLNSRKETKSLQVQLDLKRANSQAPSDIRVIMEQAKQKLMRSEIIDRAKKKGDQYIDFELPNARGGRLKLSRVLKEGPVILTFYRGVWCPYCNLQLRAYQRQLDQFENKGARLIALSPEQVDFAKANIDKNDLSFDVLTDQGNQIARKYGLVFQVGRELKKAYLTMGLNLEKNQGNDKWELPIAATYVISPSGKIIYSFLNVDYTKRAEPRDILDALAKMKK